MARGNNSRSRSNSRKRKKIKAAKAAVKASAKTQKEKNMAWWNLTEDEKKAKGTAKSTATGAKRWGIAGTTVTLPIENKDPETMSTVLFSQKTLNEIAQMCLPKAGGSEFQVHYRGAQFIVQKPDSNMRFVWTIPTYFFNMPQKVSTASVDFNLDEVSAISEQLAPMSFEMTKKIAEAFPNAFFESLGFEVKVRELEMGSIHRHPGAFGFSSTDMDNKAEKPGVIFRNLKCDDKIQVDSVMYIPGQECKIEVTETRVVTVEPSDDNGIKGQYSEAATISCILQDSEKIFGFDGFFGGDESSKIKHNFKTAKKWTTADLPQVEEIFSSFLDNMDYEPQIIVDPNLIEQEFAYARSTYQAGTYNRAHGNHASLYDYDDDEYAWNDSWYGGTKKKVEKVGFKTGEKTPGSPGVGTTEGARVLARPTWRKTQALGLLRTKGIDVNNNMKITGTASDADILAICKALKMKSISDEDIREFFVSCAYPPNSLDKYYEDLAEVVTIDNEEAASDNELDKSHVSRMLRIKGIDVEACTDIDMSGSPKDVNAINDALTEYGFNQSEIESFYDISGYTTEMLKAACEIKKAV